MHLSALLLVHVSVAVVEAWPNMGNIHARDLPLSENEGNSGPFDSLVFNASEQHVNVTPGSANEYQAPGSGDLRGPCPGLNAAANHGFLPHNGVTTLEQSKYSPAKIHDCAELLQLLLGLVQRTGLALNLLRPYLPSLSHSRGISRP